MRGLHFFDPQNKLKKKVQIELSIMEVIDVLSWLEAVQMVPSLAEELKKRDEKTACEMDVIIKKFRAILAVNPP